MAELKPYPAYKDSGVPWLGQVPGHWEVKKVRDAARVINGYPFDAARFSTKTGHPLIRIRDLNKSHTAVLYDGPFVDVARVEPGEVLVGMDGDFNIGVWSGEDVALLNQRMCCIRSQPRVTSRFLRYALPLSLQLINDICWSTTVKHLSSGQIERIKFGCPTVAEQAAIVRYLDHADRKVRHAIRARQQLIKLLTEQKQAIIQHAVTRGLDPNVRLKPSGVPWLGDVPEHWETPLNQQVFREEIRPHGGMPEMQLSLSQHHGLIATRDMQERSLQTASYDNWKVTVPGDLVLNRFKAHLGVFFAASLRGIVSFHYGVFAPKRVLDTKYFELLFHTYPYRMIYAGCSNGMTVGLQNLSNQNFYNVRCVVPPISEQVAIVACAERETQTLNTAISKLEHEISLLREYRTRLIADVVTGKLDVRDVPVPDDETDVPPEELESIDDVEAIDQTDDVAEGDSESSAEENA